MIHELYSGTSLPIVQGVRYTREQQWLEAPTTALLMNLRAKGATLNKGRYTS